MSRNKKRDWVTEGKRKAVEFSTNVLCKRLMNHGIRLDVRNNSVTTSSIYLKFEDVRLGSCTVRDHKGRAKYKYKWNLISGWDGESCVKDNGVNRFFYNFDQMAEMVEHIVNYHKAIERADQRVSH